MEKLAFFLQNACLVLCLALGASGYAEAQQSGLVHTANSPHAMLRSAGIEAVQWTGGFWGGWYETCRDVMVPEMLGHYMNDSLSHGWANFEIAAGQKAGTHEGPPFHDGDFYKVLEAMIMVNALEGDAGRWEQIDSIVSVIGASQRPDGYIHTPVVIGEQTSGSEAKAFRERLDFETYNMGHLMTAACLHYRATGQENLLDIARKATDYLCRFYAGRPAVLAENAICPSHYMGVTEMYRTTGEQRYLDLAAGLIDIRKEVRDGTDHNQDRIPFRDQRKAVGHAVRANYLYAGVADVFAESGDRMLYAALDSIWHDLTAHKLYITGGCGALYDGVSPKGTTYDQPSIQQVHQAYGEAYELPNRDAHNESCANIAFLMWNWRMFQLTGEARFMDMLERVAYNALLAGVGTDGKGYFYTNPLAVTRGISDQLRWSKTREPYIAYCNCCPPNTIRTVAEMSTYAYSLSEGALWVNLYGQNTLDTRLGNGEALALVQSTDYPWSGSVKLQLEKAPSGSFEIRLRIPGWSSAGRVSVNSVPVEADAVAGSYCAVRRVWSDGDEITLELGMDARLLEAHPLVEEARNLVAVQRGPVVYCLESADLPERITPAEVMIPVNAGFAPVPLQIGTHRLTALETVGFLRSTEAWDGALYRALDAGDRERIPLRLVPYYAWGNRGEGDMAVWLRAAWP